MQVLFDLVFLAIVIKISHQIQIKYGFIIHYPLNFFTDMNNVTENNITYQ